MKPTAALKLCANMIRPVYQKVVGADAPLAEFPTALVRAACGNVATLKVGDCRLKVDLHDVILAGQLLFLREYEPAETQLIRKIIAPGDTTVDVGANIGYFTVLMANAVGPKGFVIAVEPAPGNLSLLKQNLALNGVAPWVSIVPAAVSDEQGFGSLYCSSQNYGDHRMWRPENRVGPRETRTTSQVELVRLDDVLSAHKRIDCMKIDIQGFEPKALGGLQRKLAEQEIATMLFEFWPAAMKDAGFDPQGLISLIWRSGFKTWNVVEKRLEPLLSLGFIGNIKGNHYLNILAANPAIAERQLSTCFS